MGHRVLGVTLGDDVIRVAVVESRLRRFELNATYELRRKNGSGDPEWASTEDGDQDEAHKDPGRRAVEVLEPMLVPTLSKLDSVAVAFPGTQGFVRRLNFPFKEPGRITATLPFQMIGQVPVQPEDIHCSFEKIAVESGNTEVLAVAVPRDEFGGFLDGVRREGLDPSHVTMNGACLASLLPWIPLDEEADDEESRMLIWAEGEVADLLVARGNRPVLVRSVSVGEPVVNGGEASPAFMREVLMTMAGASEAGTSVARVLVAGPDADVTVGPLAEVLGVNCDVLDPSGLDIPGVETCDDLSPAMTLSVAVALSAASGGGPGSMNLMTGEYGRETGHGLFRENYRFFAVVLVLFALLGTAKAVGRYLGLSAERETLTAEMMALSKKELGKESGDFDKVLRTMKLQSVENARIFPAWTGVDTVSRLMSAIVSMGLADQGDGDDDGDSFGGGSGAFAVEVESIRVETKQLSVRGEASSIETLDGLVEKLKSDPCFHEVVTESTERIQFRRHQGWQRFSIRLEVDCASGGASVKLAKGSVK